MGRSGRASPDAHLRRDKTTPKMGHPVCCHSNALVRQARFVDWDLKTNGAHEFEGVAGLHDAWF